MSFLHTTNETEIFCIKHDTYRELHFRRMNHRSCLCRCRVPSAGCRQSSHTGSGSSGYMTAADTIPPLRRSRPCSRPTRHTPNPSRYTPVNRTHIWGHTTIISRTHTCGQTSIVNRTHNWGQTATVIMMHTISMHGHGLTS